MNGDLLAQAKSVVSPFVVNRVDSAWDTEAVDVEAINRTAFEHCLETIRLVRTTARCRGLLLAGEPGSGKTHLLQRLRRYVQRSDIDCFVYVPPMCGPDRVFRDVLQHTVQDLVGTRTGAATSQLETLLVRELLRAGTALPPETFWNDVRRRHPPGAALFAWLAKPMDRLCMELQLDPDVARALRHYLAEHHRFDAYAWLLGRSVPDAALERLGISRTLDDDNDALQALASLARLAGKRSVLVLAFDQLESLRMDEQDQQGLRAFATSIASLFQLCHNVAAISCVQSYFVADLKDAVSHALMDRIAQDQGAMTKLNADTAIELVANRLAAVPELQAARSAANVTDRLWPLDRAGVVRAVPGQGVSARQLLDHCRDLFEIWRQGAAPPARRRQALDDHYLARVEKAAAEPPNEGVLVDGMLKALDARAPGRAKRGNARDVDLVVAAPDGEVGVAVCNAENMTSLAVRLRRLQTEAASGKFKRLVLVRDERLPISPTARTTLERLDALARAGHVMLRPTAEAYAALAAARQLLAEAAAGDLSLEGAAVAPADVKAWLANNLGQAAVDLLDALSGGELRSDEFLERVQALLDGQWVLPAAEIAATVGVDEAGLVARLATQQRVVGVLSGPPAVLFLRPEGVRRE